jgi:hypothetical protein
MGMGYVKPLYLLPMFQQKIAYGSSGYPFNSPLYKGEARYDKGMCPNVEAAHFERVITHEMMRPGMTEGDLDDVAKAFHKVWKNLGNLR